MPIQLLPVSLANQIAAGEVIERPASVVKELVENSLDAGADQIIIEIEQGGRRLIRIRDNGGGIPRDELALALSRHATSKITSLADLEAILSLGFRGEALASISSVSRLTLTSKPATQATAWEAWVEGQDMRAELAPASHPTGTTVTVEDLFFNTPARRKFMRTDKTEFAHIEEVVKRIALARFDVRFQLLHNQKQVRLYPAIRGDSESVHRISSVCGSSFTDSALRVEEQAGSVRLTGWIAPVQACRHQADVQYFYVNGRMMKDRLLAHAIRQAYGESLQHGIGEERSPTYVLYLELPAQDVDVNVHPAKHEVRFHQARQIHDFVLHGLRGALTVANDAHDSAQSAATHGYQTVNDQVAVDFLQQQEQLKPRHASPLPGVMNTPAPPTSAELRASQQFYAPPTTAARSPVPLGPRAAVMGQWHVLSVIQQRMALVQQRESATNSLFLLDLQQVQQSCIASQLEQQWATGLAGQPLLIPVQLTQPDILALIRVTDESRLARLGVQLESSRQQVIIKQVPAALRQSDVSQSIPQLITLLSELESTTSSPPTSFWLWLATHLVQREYNVTQAEHWLTSWQQQLAAAPSYLIPVSLPPLPPAVRS
ncbi:MAG TPA: DNA mismatch repair endonuclease MutL [Pseudidiomarina sp.]|nr:DNA mismatch repair endonuclease MutL [Pseudidiomarina sp.]